MNTQPKIRRSFSLGGGAIAITALVLLLARPPVGNPQSQKPILPPEATQVAVIPKEAVVVTDRQDEPLANPVSETTTVTPPSSAMVTLEIKLAGFTRVAKPPTNQTNL
jgi:hypothetical protein